MFAFAMKKKVSFATAIDISRPDHIFLVRGKDAAGYRAWYYIIVDKGKREAFLSREPSIFLKLTDYGQILHSGFGDEPSLDVKRQMREEYGFWG